MIALQQDIDPVRITVTPSPFSVTVTADPGALDPHAGTLHLQVKLAKDECGGSFVFTNGPTVIDTPVDPQPSANAAAGKLPEGTWTVCAFLDDDENRQFATDTDTTLTVGPTGATTPKAGGCTRLAHLPKKVTRGSLIYSARVARKKGHATLLVKTRTAAIVTARGRHHVKPCKQLVVRLKGKHGRLRLAASIKRGSERRTVKY